MKLSRQLDTSAAVRAAELAAMKDRLKASELKLERKLAVASKKEASKSNTRRGHQYQDEVDLYVRQLLNPFEEMNAVVPDIHGFPTTTFSVTTPFKLTTNADGRLCLFVRDGLTFHHVQNDTSSPSKTDGLKYSPTGAVGWCYDGAAGSTWQSGAKVESIRGTFSAYRPVAMGVRVVYDAAPTTASGRLAIGYFPGAQTLPFRHGSDATYGITFDDFAEYQNVITGAAISGGTTIWKPLTPQNHFRPTKAWFYNGSTDVYTEMAYTNDQLSEGGATWDIDPEVCPSMQGLGLFADDAVITESVAEAATKINVNSLPINTPMLCVMGEGLPANTQVLAGEIVAHYEGVADNRSFSLVQSSHRYARPGAMDRAIHRVSKVNPSHTGGSIEHHTSWVDKAMNITRDVANVAGTIGAIVNSVPRVVQPLLEAAETVAALI